MPMTGNPKAMQSQKVRGLFANIDWQSCVPFEVGVQYPRP
jgi:hypothetical protein